jgi:hypothetical protein
MSFDAMLRPPTGCQRFELVLRAGGQNHIAALAGMVVANSAPIPDEAPVTRAALTSPQNIVRLHNK